MIENLSDYSSYVITSYAVVGLVLIALGTYIIVKYLKIRNRKNAKQI